MSFWSSEFKLSTLEESNSSKSSTISLGNLDSSAIFIASTIPLLVKSRPFCGIPNTKLIFPDELRNVSSPSEISSKLSTVKYPAMIFNLFEFLRDGTITSFTTSLGL